MLLTHYDEAITDFQSMLQMARASGHQHKEGESLCHLAYAHWLTFSEEHIPLVEHHALEAAASGAPHRQSTRPGAEFIKPGERA